MLARIHSGAALVERNLAIADQGAYEQYVTCRNLSPRYSYKNAECHMNKVVHYSLIGNNQDWKQSE